MNVDELASYIKEQVTAREHAAKAIENDFRFVALRRQLDALKQYGAGLAELNYLRNTANQYREEIALAIDKLKL